MISQDLVNTAMLLAPLSRRMPGSEVSGHCVMFDKILRSVSTTVTAGAKADGAAACG